MRLINLLSAIFCAFLFFSCTNEIPLNIKDNEPKLIVNALVNIDNSSNMVAVALTGKYDIDSVQDATVNVYINEELKEQVTQHIIWEADTLDGLLHPLYLQKDKRYEILSHFSPGDKVKIEVFANNNAYHAWAEDIIPYPIEIEHIDTMSYLKDYSSYIRLKTTFTDKSNEKNFYRFMLMQKTTYYEMDENGNPIPYSYEAETFINTREDIVLNDGKVSTDDDFLIQTENLLAIFDDTRLNGTYTMTTSLYTPSYYMEDTTNLPKNEITIQLLSITEAQYHYLKALNIRYSDNYDEYLSTPIVYPSNVAGGIGIVGFTSGAYKTLNIPFKIYSPFSYSKY